MMQEKLFPVVHEGVAGHQLQLGVQEEAPPPLPPPPSPSTPPPPRMFLLRDRGGPQEPGYHLFTLTSTSAASAGTASTQKRPRPLSLL